jgi:hypothetical protein
MWAQVVKQLALAASHALTGDEIDLVAPQLYFLASMHVPWLVSVLLDSREYLAQAALMLPVVGMSLAEGLIWVVQSGCVVS